MTKHLFKLRLLGRYGRHVYIISCSVSLLNSRWKSAHITIFIIMSNYIFKKKSNLIWCYFIVLLLVSCFFSTPQAHYWI